MFKQAITTAVGAATLLFGAALPIHAAPEGKAELDSIVPDGPIDPASGAPLDWNKPVPDQQIHKMLLIDRLEYGATDGTDNYLWDTQGLVRRRLEQALAQKRG
ncbi:hypothetical protein SSPSH_001014 [Salinisphaera shabanensis E1L3A]|uniref:Uncharacterized protein n=1 Tax=Salinisphaera shabanensis E1L3A TaxID=1033802 RepID=U2FVA2_9GAMM|nr:hypothetical protein [Salinisphaera shabanensis]ERJ19849.1 hypothetical protein SSPSH_001014 [Salinisphaera shabanensis E1L3A]